MFPPNWNNWGRDETSSKWNSFFLITFLSNIPMPNSYLRQRCLNYSAQFLCSLASLAMIKHYSKVIRLGYNFVIAFQALTIVSWWQCELLDYRFVDVKCHTKAQSGTHSSPQIEFVCVLLWKNAVLIGSNEKVWSALILLACSEIDTWNVLTN